MSFDNSRYTFDPFKNYAGVVMEQGRVQLDADWNEWLAEISRRIQAGTLDIMGHAAYPPTTPNAFLITATTGSPNTVTIGCGRMYVDGLLAENHGQHKNAVWDPALAELSGSPQPADTANPNPTPFTHQPYLPGATLPTDNGAYLAYLDVWTRAVDYLEDPHLVDKAVGVDTTGRLQTVWQVKLMPNTGNWNCQTPDSQIPYPPSSAGQLTTNVVPNATAGPCCLTDGSGYTGQENQFYRVEIHQGGQGSDTPTASTATFKWSRDNASVETGVTAINGAQNSMNQPASQLTVLSLGRDQVLGFKNGDWIELLDDWSELWGNPGVVCQIDSVSFPNKTITLTTTVDTTPAAPGPGVPANFPVDTNFLTTPHRHTRIRRWDQRGKVHDQDGNPWCDLSATGGLIPVPATKTLVLENGITVQFGLNSAMGSSPQFNVADFWTFAARTADGSVEKLKAAPPRGIHHHYAKLSTLAFTAPSASNPDCRQPWGTAAEGDCGCCSCTVGDNVNTFGKFPTIMQAIASLPTTGAITGGEVCLLPGRYYEYVSLNNLTDVTIRGCGPETRLASPSMKPGATPPTGTPTNPITTETGFAAILTVVDCQSILFENFAIEAADGEVGILLDRSSWGAEYGEYSNQGGNYFWTGLASNWDVTLAGLQITASTLPAILASRVDLLKVSTNRIAIEDEAGQWASVYASGREIRIEKNWIGLQDAENAQAWISDMVVSDVPAGFNPKKSPANPVANGGIHIGGSSQDVFVLDNEIEGGARNGITLGSFAIYDSSGDDIGGVTGLLPAGETQASGSYSLGLPATYQLGNIQGTLAAANPLWNVEISRNRIRNMGLCGIGPVGFFDFADTIEIIGIQNLTVAGNVISESLQDTLSPKFPGSANFGYGAICLPDVQNLIVRDNTITDFGVSPGATVCGIFVFNGEQVEISRNQVIETRDWSTAYIAPVATAGVQAGIGIVYVSPPALDQSDDASSWSAMDPAGDNSPLPLYQPGLPALRIENNVVRVPLGRSLEVVGIGPFSIANNHFTAGGTIQAPATGQKGGFISAYFLNVVVYNLGGAIELDPPSNTYSGLYASGGQFTPQAANNALALSSSGAVDFTGNRCQLETRASGAEGIVSVTVLTYDCLNFAGNHLWVDGGPTAAFDALLLAGSLQVNNNRFQEAVGSVGASGVTYGLANITAYNIATNCLFASGAQAWTIPSPNVILNPRLCPDSVLNQKP